MRVFRKFNVDFGDQDFYKTMLAIAIPVTIQQLISSLLNMLDIVMVGQLGDSAIAALGLSNQVFFLLNLLLFGLTSGMSVFTSQYWGQRDVANIRRVLGLCLTIALAASGFFSIAAYFFPVQVLSFYTNDQMVIEIGARYLRVVSLSYLLTSISYSYYAVLRSIRQVRLPMVINVVALSIKAVIGYVLIFGLIGFPAFGVEGAAYSTLIARVLEVVLVVGLTYRLRTPAAARLRELTGYNFSFAYKIMATALPALINEIVWSLGVTTYNAIYAHIGTNAIAAVNIVGTFENLAFVTSIGIGTACAVMVGNSIGAGDRERAFRLGKIYLALGLLVSIATAVILVVFSPELVGLYQVSDETAAYAHQILLIYALTLWLRATNFMLFIGALRAGGDTTYAMIVETCTMWTVGVPLVFWAGLSLRLAVPWVYLIVLVEEFTKLMIIFPRFRSKKWIHDLVAAV